MNKIKYLIFVIGLVFIMGSCCNHNSKSDTWSDEQKAEWTESCLKMMSENQVFKGNAEDVCDCMLKKTSENYTPEEAVNITEEEEQKIWETCDYSW